MAKNSDDSSKDIIDRGVKNSNGVKNKKQVWKMIIPFVAFFFGSLIFAPYIDYWYRTNVTGKWEEPIGVSVVGLCVFICILLVEIFKISRRTSHRYSITSLFYLTTIFSIYAGMFATLEGKMLVFLNELATQMVVSLVAFLIVNRFVSNGVFFMESWGNQRDNVTLVVPYQWYWPAHLFVAASILVLWTNRFWIDLFSLDQFYCFCMLFALWGHLQAVRRTSIRVYDEGVEIVDKFWRWEDGALKLFEHQGDFRLGPSRLIDKSKWRKYLWPVVPEENLEAVRESIILKQELAERREGYYAS